MFNKLKNKISEEVKPFSFQASVQQFTQAVTSNVLSTATDSINNLPTNNELEVRHDTAQNTVSSTIQDDGEFTTIDLKSTPPFRSRRLSSSSTTSELFPIYETCYSKSNLQTDFESASEFDDSSSIQADHVTKENLYNNYRKMQQKYNKYRGRYVDLFKFCKELEHDNNKTKKLLSETQDKAIQRITELKEQCSLEQKAKAHLEETLRADLEERDHLINTLNDKIGWLKSSNNNSVSEGSCNNNNNNISESSEPLQPLVNLSENTNSKINNDVVNNRLKEKVKHFEILLGKAKEALTLKNQKLQDLTSQLNNQEKKHEEYVAELKATLESAEQKIASLQETVVETKRREEESALSLAENKLTIHKELEEKESQIKILNTNIVQVRKENENLHRKVQEFESMNKNGADSTERLDISPPVQNSFLRIEEESKFLSDDMKLRIAHIKDDFLKYLNIKELKDQVSTRPTEEQEQDSRQTQIRITLPGCLDDAINSLRSELYKTPFSKENSEKYLIELERFIKQQLLLVNLDERILSRADESKTAGVRYCENETQTSPVDQDGGVVVDNRDEEIVENDETEARDSKDMTKCLSKKKLEECDGFIKREIETLSRLIERRVVERYKNLADTLEQSCTEKEGLTANNMTEEFDTLIGFLTNYRENEVDSFSDHLRRVDVEDDEVPGHLLSQIGSLRGTFDRAKIEQDELVCRLLMRLRESVEDKVSRMRKDLEAHASSLEEERNSLRRQSELLREQLDEHRRTMLDKVKQIDRLEQSSNECRERTIEMEKLLAGKEEDTRRCRLERDESLAKVDAVRRELLEMREKCEVAEMRQRTSLKEYEEKIGELRSTLTAYESETGRLRTDITSLQEELEAERTGKLDLSGRYERLRIDMSALEECNRSNARTYKTLAGEYDRVLEIVKTYSVIVTNLKSHLLALRLYCETDLKVIRENVGTLNRLFVERIRAVERRYETRVAELNERNVRLKKSFRSYERIYEPAFDELRITIESLKSELTEIYRVLVDYFNDNKISANRYENLRFALQRVGEQAISLKRDYQTSKFSCQRDLARLLEYVSRYKMETIRSNDVDDRDDRTIIVASSSSSIDSSSEGELSKNDEIFVNGCRVSGGECDENEAPIKKKDLSKLMRQLPNRNKVEMQRSSSSSSNSCSNENYVERLKDESDGRLKQIIFDFQNELAKKNEEYEQLKNEKFDKNEKMENEVYHELNRIIQTTQDDLLLKNDAFERLIEEFEEYKRRTETEKEEIQDNHVIQLHEMDQKWRQCLDKKISELENKNKEEISELSKEWTNERKQLESVIGNSTCDLTMIESLEKRISILSQELNETKKIHKKEINDLQRLLKIPKENKILENEVSLEDCTEMEYLRNVLYEYMMGKEPVVLAKVLSAIVKFDADQTKKILDKEEQKLSLLSHFHLGL